LSDYSVILVSSCFITVYLHLVARISTCVPPISLLYHGLSHLITYLLVLFLFPDLMFRLKFASYIKDTVIYRTLCRLHKIAPNPNQSINQSPTTIPEVHHRIIGTWCSLRSLVGSRPSEAAKARRLASRRPVAFSFYLTRNRIGRKPRFARLLRRGSVGLPIAVREEISSVRLPAVASSLVRLP
jgi:hypothetical protein